MGIGDRAAVVVAPLSAAAGVDDARNPAWPVALPLPPSRPRMSSAPAGVPGSLSMSTSMLMGSGVRERGRQVPKVLRARLALPGSAPPDPPAPAPTPLPVPGPTPTAPPISGRLWQSSQRQMEEQCTPASKHSQYFLRQRDLRQRHPFLCVMSPVSFCSTWGEGGGGRAGEGIGIYVYVRMQAAAPGVLFPCASAAATNACNRQGCNVKARSRW